MYVLLLIVLLVFVLLLLISKLAFVFGDVTVFGDVFEYIGAIVVIDDGYTTIGVDAGMHVVDDGVGIAACYLYC